MSLKKSENVVEELFDKEIIVDQQLEEIYKKLEQIEIDLVKIKAQLTNFKNNYRNTTLYLNDYLNKLNNEIKK